MKVALADKKERTPVMPPNIIETKIDSVSGFLGNNLTEYFIKGTEPTKKYIVEKAYKLPQEAKPHLEQRLGLPPKELLNSPGSFELF
ncbi:hypothetical protein AP460_00319 [Actinobacillus pleuropneumoniae]|nr:membrane carboxypeptidase/penicillin-binding protein [Actinobacillus pleuropneumoniae]KIE93606.1 hypothetical protein AP460_00319 [Actinobacillus pleuropneumoniae]KIE93802.1 membrane carboxypeptidase/penicillin-binding protein [Actinobacillus pleuropneumoniae]KIE99874.1 membrane carboxypeptidase/penicillin-binding protein [Actinobacillus pleuropneumoniae]KIF00235.1 membrane carboxypeptidase/penicillin-binding protein [Actinobacillus pleuropneumoniae]